MGHSDELPSKVEFEGPVRLQSNGQCPISDRNEGKEAELQRTVWQLQQKNATLEKALQETLVRSASMEADNVELREFVNSLVGRIANLEGQLAGCGSGTPPLGNTPSVGGTLGSPSVGGSLGVAAMRGAGQQPQQRRGKGGQDRSPHSLKR